MILPGSTLFSIILLAISLLCWGSWTNSVKMAAGSRWRFELFSYDFAVGAFVVALIAAFTFGSLGLDGFTVMDDLRLAGKKQDVIAFGAGCVFNLANMLIIAAVSFGGITVALPVSFGMSIVIGALLSKFVSPGANMLLMGAGATTVLGAVVFDAVGWKRYTAIKTAEAKEAAAAAALAAQAGQPKPAPGTKPAKPKKAKKKSGRGKVLFLAILGGIILGLALPLADLARVSKDAENGIGPYTIALMFTLGILLSTFMYNLFFLNLPLQGNALEMGDYFKGTAPQHVPGMVGGAIWCIGTIALFVTQGEGAPVLDASLSSVLIHSVPVVGALWGLLAWKEFEGADGNIKLLLGAMFLLMLGGIGVIAAAPVFGAH